MIDASLLNLPWATLVTLASGYIGYFIANVGLKEHHKPIDITFTTLVFCLSPAGLYHSAVWLGVNTYIASVPAVISAFTVGSVWRKYGKKWMYGLLRKYDISWSDSTNSAWQRMFDQRGYYVSEIYVYLKNGSTLLSEAPGHFEGQPCGCFVLGNEKDILLYVTHEKAAGSTDWKECSDVLHEAWGALATYVPADQIARVQVRRTKFKEVRVLPEE
ncbi:hypothetical protein [Candidatus Symbiopectobacterium sp.]|uniref:hypothetical protein n=1 Tax=Candidatus Symbiopectobacterium sp. TaxID=2816440 RepID=UPI0025B9C98D|nr:hypothetical protein [Candidatus Symbiopectobacterium sp.]